MRSLPVVFLLWLPLAAQTPDAARQFAKGAVSARLVLNLPSTLEAGDHIDVSCSTSDLRVTLITPDGRRVTSQTASSAFVVWFESPSSEPDWGRSVIMTFRRAAQSGAYAIEVSGQTRNNSTVNVFVSAPSKTHAAAIEKAFPGAIVAPAVRAPATIALDVKEQQETSLIDVLTPDPDTRIVLTLPDGRAITPESLGPEGGTAQAERVARLLFPQSGRHHVFYFQRAPQGVYRISAGDGEEHAEFRALFVPYEQGWNKYMAEFSSRKLDLRSVSR